uniref:Uncharacterized protein n=1 Tax=Trichinella nativa TaxID=6335 RepID=A0A0V1KIZ2_9BILA
MAGVFHFPNHPQVIQGRPQTVSDLPVFLFGVLMS